MSATGLHHPVHALGGHAMRRPAYTQINLVSDGSVPALQKDPNLVNAWGISSGANTPFWVSSNGKGVSTLNNVFGTPQSLVVTIPAPTGADSTSAPTGQVFNNSSRTSDFHVGGVPARFLFATEDGTIAAWASGTTASLVVDNSAKGAIYKGLALGNTVNGSRLYATDFHNARVDVWDGGFAPVSLPAGAFTDPKIPAGFAPFGISNVGGNLVVTYAKQDSTGTDDVAGRGLGYVDIFDPNGNLIGRVGARGSLNAPWGVALAPAGFGRFSHDLLIGDFGDGRINAYRPVNGRYQFDGQLTGANGRALAIDGLWGLQFGSNVGQPSVLYFAAGPNDESGGLFGAVAAT
ncbi:MAG TPA: TIGR03118 family protein [Isosphaeraceae bacterium]|nr:TIGR03118 family protein [Isosphaeraceae bacterium]